MTGGRMVNGGTKTVKYKLLVVDIDGTLVGREGTISVDDKRALAAVRLSGVQVALSTGRVAKSCSGIMRELSLDGDHVFFDGALAGNPELGREVYAQPLSVEIVRQVVEFARTNETYIELYTSVGYFIEREIWGTEVHRRFFGLEPVLVDFDAIRDERIIKGEMFVSSPEEEEKARTLQNWFDGRLRFSWARTPAYPNARFINVLDPVVSKGRALEALVSHLGIAMSEVVAIGDGTNDIPQLSVAGMAIAMGNALDEVKAVADYVTLDVENSGLARAIEEFII